MGTDTSYPYLGYVVVDIEFPEKVTGTKDTLSVLALICPSPQSPEQTPVILGTNANLFQRLARLCKETSGVDISQTLGIKVMEAALDTDHSATEGEEDEVGCVRWMGPGFLKVPPGGECTVVGEVEWKKPLSADMLMVEASPTATYDDGQYSSGGQPLNCVDPECITEKDSHTSGGSIRSAVSCRSDGAISEYRDCPCTVRPPVNPIWRLAHSTPVEGTTAEEIV